MKPEEQRPTRARAPGKAGADRVARKGGSRPRRRREESIAAQEPALTPARLEDLNGPRRSGTNATPLLWESFLFFFMLAILVWGALALVMVVYTTLVGPVYQAQQPHLLMAANLLGGAIGATLLLCYRRFSASYEALQRQLWEQREEFHRHASQASITDGLTGLYTLVYFWRRVEEEIGRAWRYDHPFAVLLIDLQDFNSVNERHGRLTGDLVLRQFSQAVLKDTVRAMDIPARYGGDQFAVLLPETEEQGARRLAERLQQRLQQEIRLPSGRALTMVSAVVAFPADGVRREGLLGLAESRLKEAKREEGEGVAAVGP